MKIIPFQNIISDKTLTTIDYSPWNVYDKLFPGYIHAIKREQKFLKSLLNIKYNKTIRTDNLVVLVYIHTDFGKRTNFDYKVVSYMSKDYFKFKNTDDYNCVGTFTQLKEWLNKNI